MARRQIRNQNHRTGLSDKLTVTRRAYLTAFATGGIIAVAGCTDAGNEDRSTATLGRSETTAAPRDRTATQDQQTETPRETASGGSTGISGLDSNLPVPDEVRTAVGTTVTHDGDVLEVYPERLAAKSPYLTAATAGGEVNPWVFHYDIPGSGGERTTGALRLSGYVPTEEADDAMIEFATSEAENLEKAVQIEGGFLRSIYSMENFSSKEDARPYVQHAINPRIGADPDIPEAYFAPFLYDNAEDGINALFLFLCDQQYRDMMGEAEGSPPLRQFEWETWHGDGNDDFDELVYQQISDTFYADMHIQENIPGEYGGNSAKATVGAQITGSGIENVVLGYELP